MEVFIRYDDYSRNSPIDVDKRLFDAVHRAGGRTLVGAIPFPSAPYPNGRSPDPNLSDWMGEDKIEWLRQFLANGSITLGLHGFAHRNNAGTGRPPTEFRGMPEPVQRQLISIGKSEFQRSLGFAPEVFIPPYNTYDEATLAAMVANGIRVIAAGAYVPRMENPVLRFLPGGIYPDQLAGVVDSALKRHADGIIFVTAHAYDFAGGSREMPRFRGNAQPYPIGRFVDDLSRLRAIPDVRFISLEDLLAREEDLSQDRLAANAGLSGGFLQRYGLIPAVFGLDPVPGIYYSKADANTLQLRLWLVFSLMYAGIAGASAVGTAMIVRRSPLRFKSVLGWLLVAALLGSIFGFLHLAFEGGYTRTAIALTILAGATFGLLIERIRSTNTSPATDITRIGTGA